MSNHVLWLHKSNDEILHLCIDFVQFLHLLRSSHPNQVVTTLTLGSQPRQGLTKVRAKNEFRSHISCSQECKRVWGMNPTLPNELPLWELESQWTPEFSEGDCRGWNSLDWEVPSIIGKLLKHWGLKWARMTHLGFWNISYGQKKDWESNCQFDSQPLKVKNCPDFLVCRWHATYR